ncbi:15732_t:CDS:10 [Funneliformis geosporum]|uniref:tRNA (guanine(37)-N1)-methyltransferase n=1 Tax=Funneliformis geosporum TaxID=1117311 RepID=A0A9W4STG6_9GLOM|nr:19517_t:CDS:10 [Funneliformis geosporum]CAI2182393.1 15732_t:CDS:10 [Funneliformis geosporum]
MIPAPIQRGMIVLNRELFQHKISVIGIRVPANSTAKFLKVLNKELFNQPKLRNVVDDPGSNLSKIILMNLKFQSLDLDDLPNEMKDFINKEGLGVVRHSVELKYDYWGVDDILKAILPESSESPSSFTQVGHIAHMNLREEFLPWKFLIGQVILDVRTESNKFGNLKTCKTLMSFFNKFLKKNPKITTVVNKIDMIDSTYRIFNMEILAGKNDMIAVVKESNCKFRFDFSQVYWNSRLHTEHDRLVKMFKKGDYICDVFAGVGPFAIPAAKKGCIVYANDLNPVSYKHLQENISLNKVNNNIYPYNLDGYDFIKKAVQDLEKSLTAVDKTKSPKSEDLVANQSLEFEFRTFNHFIMNLPATAIEFLDAFKGLFKNKVSYIKNPCVDLPMIHCHCFSKNEMPEKEIIERINSTITYPMQADKFKFHFVRKVAPNKDMFCVSFRLSQEVAFAIESTKSKSDLDEVDTLLKSNEQDLVSKRRKIA